ncbi:MAG: acyltransferase family protein [Rhodoferax sp.]|nr:acyltransferase family protein [Rhodoferax sp.]
MSPQKTVLNVVHNPHLNYRPDIDGLRALAIVAVVIFHAFPHFLPSGFIGVDVFFVISGYLITSIILKAQSGTGFSLLDFYIRRIQRIFPALIVVLVFCLVAGWFVLVAEEYQSLGKHVAAGAVYISNFVLKAESGYFNVASELKPLLHLWSLSIEEQFYLVWPLLLILALRSNINPLTAIVLMLAISFLLNIVYIERLPTHVFYLPISRSWELLIGSILAYINLYKRYKFDQIASKILPCSAHKTGSQVSNVFALAGAALIILSMVGLNKGDKFPGWWALLPTIGTFFLIAAGEVAWLNSRILASKPFVFIGLISYPLYLWHWPLLSFARIVETGTPSALIRLGVVTLSGLLAWATYRLIETRFRFQEHWVFAAGLFAALIMTGIIGYQVYMQEGYAERHPQEERLASNFAWDKQGWNHQKACTERFGEDFQQYCQIHDVNRLPTVLLIGDSNANHFFPGLLKMYTKSDENLLNLGQGACPPFLGVDVALEPGNIHCEKTIDKALSYALDTKSVHTVVLSMLIYTKPINEKLFSMSYRHNSAIIEPLKILEDAMRVTLSRLTSADKRVIFIMSIPILDFNPETCINYRPWRITSAQLKTPCSMSKIEADKLSRNFRSMVNRVLQNFPKVTLWDSSRELCDEVSCYAMRDGILLYRDTSHLNEAGSLYMGERLPLQDMREKSKQ